MKNRLYLLLVFLTFITLGCKNKSNVLKNDVINENLEYSVYNQTLSLLGENILFNNFDIPTSKEFDAEIFNERYPIKNKKELFERIKNEKIDTSKISLSRIEFLILPDSLTKNGDLKSKVLKLDKINHPKGVILIKENDSIRRLDFFIKSIELSRVVFNSDHTKATFEVGIIRGKMNGKGYKIKCELRNGAWVIVEKKITWIS